MTAIPSHMYGTARQFGPLPDASTKRGPYAGLQYHEVYGGVIPLSVASQFDIRTDGIGTMECAKFRRRFGLRHLSFNRELGDFYIRLARENSYRDANRSLSQLSESLILSGVCGRFNLTHDDESLVNLADAISRKLASLLPASLDGDFIPDDFPSVCSILVDYGILGATGCDSTTADIAAFFKRHGYGPARARLSEPSFIARCLRSFKALKLADITREIGLVCRTRQPYVSDYVCRLRREQRDRNDVMIDGLVVVNEKDQTDYADLRDMVDASVSNPSIRQAELVTRIKGLAQIAVADRHTGLFLTFTTPSRFHGFDVTGKENPAWLEAKRPTVRDAHAWLTDCWAKIRAQLSKSGIHPYGLRVVEPHHDGTPHWHLVLFVPPSQARQLRDICRSQLLADSPDEPGARLHRFKCKTVNTRKYGPDAAIRYCLFYVTKNLQGTKGAADEVPASKSEAMAARVDAWKSAYHLRQFSQIGAQYVTVWRQLRRLRSQFTGGESMFNDLLAGEWLAIENLRKAADAGDYEAFIRAMGGVHVRRDDRTLVAQYTIPQALSKLTGQMENQLTRYGDVASARVMGLLWQRSFGDFIERRFVPTRFKDWTIENKRKFIAGIKKVMDGTIDIFDAMEQQDYYLSLYESHMQKMELLADRSEGYFDFVIQGDIQPELFELSPLEFVSADVPIWAEGGAPAGGGGFGPLDLCQ